MAILGEFVYSAMGKESLTSAVAMADPFAPDLTLERDFLALPRLEGVLTDQHLQERDRIGRTLALLARIMKDGWSARPAPSLPTAKPPSTSILPMAASKSTRPADHPTPFAYFLRPTRPPDRCVPASR